MLSVEEEIQLEVIARAEQERLEAEQRAAEESGAADPIAPDVAIGRLSRLDSMQMQEVAKDAAVRRERRIYALGQALQRMDDGEYGSCDACGGPIAFDRLEALPEVTRCADCA